MTFWIASAFGTFVAYLALGLGALLVTAALDRRLGKERALLLYALALVALTALAIAPTAQRLNPVAAGVDEVLSRAPLDRAGDPFDRAPLDHQIARNVFEPYSDTRDLPPPRIEAPPWLELEFPLPPTVPGPAPAARHLLRGALPALTAGDGSRIPEIPKATYEEYNRKPEDVYDWLMQGGRRQYLVILAIETPGGWVRENDRGFVAARDALLFLQPGWEDQRVRFALVGPEEAAAQRLGADAQLEARRRNISERRGSDGGIERFWIHRSVDVLEREALRRHGVPFDLAQAQDPDALARAAADLAEVGRTGKENREGWRRAARLLERALHLAREKAGPTKRAELLVRLRQAYRALNEEANELRALAEYATTSPGSHEVHVWVGDMHRHDLHLPELARGYYQVTLERNPGHAEAWLGMGDAWAFDGHHARALEAYGKAGPHPDAGLRKATALLRLGRGTEALAAAEAVLARDASNAEARLVRGGALYLLGRLEPAREAFLAVALDPAANALRAQACYDLALACLRLGQNDAALQALVGLETALSRGAVVAPIPDETLSPALVRGLLAHARGEGPGAFLEQANLEAPLSSYRAMASGAINSRAGADSTALRHFDDAKQRAPDYRELDAWLALSYLRQAGGAAATGAEASETQADFRRAVAHAARAADDDARRDRNAWRMRVREALVRLGAQHLPRRQRYEEARAAVQKVLGNPNLQEQPIARAVAAYADFQLENYEECIRGFQAVLDIVTDSAPAEHQPWRGYAAARLDEVKRWRELEELTLRLEGVALDNRLWTTQQSRGATVKVDEGTLRFEGTLDADGRLDEPSVFAQTEALFEKDTFEEVRLKLRIPREDRQGAINKVVFGVQVVHSRGRTGSSTKTPGLGVFFDRTKLAARLGGGADPAFKDGEVRRLPGDQAWPVDRGDVVEVRIVREDPDAGTMVAYLNDKEVLRDTISGWKRGRGKTLLWIGGYGNTAEKVEVVVSEIRVIRRKAR